MKEDYRKALKKFIFSFEPSSFSWTRLWKTKGTWKWQPVTLQVTKQVQKNSFILYIYYLTKFDDSVKSGFSVTPTNTSANLCKAILDIINFPFQGIIQKKSASDSRMLPCLITFIWNFILIWKCRKWCLNRGTLV